MYCTACGSWMEEAHSFCTHCGAPRPAADPGPRGSRGIPLLITALMFLVGLAVYGFSQLGWNFF